MNSEILAILDAMEIPVWIPKNSPLLKLQHSVPGVPDISCISSIFIPESARYALLLGLAGKWGMQAESVQVDQFSMLKRLICALNWNFEACMITEVNTEQVAIVAFVNAFKQSNIEKIIVFGNDLVELVGNLRPDMSVIVIPSVVDLMCNPMAKKEAWGRLLPHKIL